MSFSVAGGELVSKGFLLGIDRQSNQDLYHGLLRYNREVSELLFEAEPIKRSNLPSRMR